MSDGADRVCVGAIAGAFGVRGEVRLKSFCAAPGDIATYGPIETEDGSQSFKISGLKPIKAGFSARLSGVGTKEAADALRGTRLFANRAELPRLPEDEYYHADLIGLAVNDTGGETLGKIQDVHNYGATDLLEILPSGQKLTVLLPFTVDNVPLVDISAGLVVIDPPAGTFEG